MPLNESIVEDAALKFARRFGADLGNRRGGEGNYPAISERSKCKPKGGNSMSNEPSLRSDLILYQTEDGRTRIQCRFENETVWLTQQHMAELFQTTKQNVGHHLKSLFAEGELVQDSVVKDSFTTAADGKNYATKFYNLDVIISVGYRVKSQRGTQFRIWATQRLREYIVKGFTMDDERLKNPPGKGHHIDYFDELLERIRDIRASERRVYLRVREILALAADCEASNICPRRRYFLPYGTAQSS